MAHLWPRRSAALCGVLWLPSGCASCTCVRSYAQFSRVMGAVVLARVLVLRPASCVQVQAVSAALAACEFLDAATLQLQWQSVY
jgi:hypothetical protein